MNISVLVGTRNRSAPLRRCLESIARQRRQAFEVIVLDDASDAVDVRAIVADAGCPGARVIRSDAQLGVGPGRNLLLRAARGDVCFIIDDDAWMERADVLGNVVIAFESHPRAAIVAARIVNHRQGARDDLIPFPRMARRREPDIGDRPQLASYFLGGAHAIRRDAAERLGGYDDGFTWGEEELDLSYRVIQAGLEIFYDPGVVVEHEAMPAVLASSGRLRGELYYHVRNRFLIARKYLPAAYVPPYLAIWLARYTFSAVRHGSFRDLARGTLSGMALASSRKRTPMRADALAYLRRNHGRLVF